MSRRQPARKIRLAPSSSWTSPPLRRNEHLECCADTILSVRNGYHATVCTGEAHSNAFVDNCGMCMGHVWGFRAVKDEVEP